MNRNRCKARTVWLALTMLTALAFACNARAAGYVPCSYTARNEGFDQHPDCARAAGGGYVIRGSHLARMDFGGDGLAGVFIVDQFFYVKPDGRMLPVVAYDNGPDYFAEGLTRARINGKIAYYDRRFRQVIGPRYDWGTPFAHGRARVCNGCAPTPPDEDGHFMMTGGDWGVIDRHGREIVPLGSADENAP